MSDYDPYFEVGETIKMGKSASIPEAEVLDILTRHGDTVYHLHWTNGVTNMKIAEEIDKKAINKTPKF